MTAQDHGDSPVGCLVKIAAVSLALAVLLALLWWTSADPWVWPRIVSPDMDMRNSRGFAWVLPPTQWDDARGEPHLKLWTGYDWQRMPIQEDCAIRISLHDRTTNKQTEVVLGRRELAYGESFVARCDVEGGFEAQVFVETANPELGSGRLRVEGNYEQDTRDMDFVREWARLGAPFFVLLSLATGFAGLRLRARSHDKVRR